MFQEILNWSEVWALLIPLAILIWKRPKAEYLKPVKLYVWLALLIGIAADILWRYKVKLGMHPGDLLWSNNFLYNTHAIIRFLLFSWFFILLKQPFIPGVKKAIRILFLLFFAIYFIFIKDYFDTKFSSLLLSTASALLLFYCIQYFIYLLMEEHSLVLSKQPGFWIVSGLSLYTAASFFIFLFYTSMVNRINPKNPDDKWKIYAVNLWNIHNIAFIILCLFLARAFYARSTDK